MSGDWSTRYNSMLIFEASTYIGHLRQVHIPLGGPRVVLLYPCEDRALAGIRALSNYNHQYHGTAQPSHGAKYSPSRAADSSNF